MPFYYFFDYTIILLIPALLFGLYAQFKVSSTYKKYSQVKNARGFTAAEVARKILDDNGLYDVAIVKIAGNLTDNFNPKTKTVSLSETVYNSQSVAAIGVAAHECGHAVQKAHAYSLLKMRSALVPVVQFSSSIMTWVLLAGILMVNTFPQLLLAGICLFAITTLFSFITLPVEINASHLALVWLSNAGITKSYNNQSAKSALRSGV